MSQHDMVINNQGFAATRVDINGALAALVSNNSGASEPSTKYAYMWWPDTTTGIMKQRNSANSGWVSMWNLATGLPYPAASQAEMEAGTETALRSMSPLRVKQAIAVLAEGGSQIQPISVVPSGNTLIISATAPMTLKFRSETLSSGATTTVTGTPANLVISNGSTLGSINGVQSELLIRVLNNAGTLEFTAENISGGMDASETGLISTTAEGGAGAADSATVIYSTTARIGKAYRVIGLVRSTQATAGQWATTPSLVQGAGGNALTSMQSLGYGQTWQNVTGSRALATTYYNTTGKPIQVLASLVVGASSNSDLTINGVSLGNQTGNGNTNSVVMPISFTVPAGQSYRMAVTVGGVTINKWSELR